MIDVIEGRKNISEIIATSSQGVSIVSGGSGLEAALAIDVDRASAVINAFAELESQFDVMLVDISAGGNEGVLRFLSACHHQIVIGTNEPSSVADAYALIKLMSFTMGLDKVVFLPNRVRTSQEGRLLFDKMNIITVKHLGLPLKYIGSLSESLDYSQAWSSGTTAVSQGNSTVAYLDFKHIVNELGKLTVNHKNSELQFFRPK
jgi:flagellar biosynthesis protein FlhG